MNKAPAANRGNANVFANKHGYPTQRFIRPLIRPTYGVNVNQLRPPMLQRKQFVNYQYPVWQQQQQHLGRRLAPFRQRPPFKVPFKAPTALSLPLQQETSVYGPLPDIVLPPVAQLNSHLEPDTPLPPQAPPIIEPDFDDRQLPITTSDIKEPIVTHLDGIENDDINIGDEILNENQLNAPDLDSDILNLTLPNDLVDDDFDKIFEEEEAARTTTATTNKPTTIINHIEKQPSTIMEPHELASFTEPELLSSPVPITSSNDDNDNVTSDKNDDNAGVMNGKTKKIIKIVRKRTRKIKDTQPSHSEQLGSKSNSQQQDKNLVESKPLELSSNASQATSIT